MNGAANAGEVIQLALVLTSTEDATAGTERGSLAETRSP